MDSFEELLSATEVANAREFWASMWRAGEVEAQERGAWRALVGGSGSGRAAYIIKQYMPDNLPDKPGKVDTQDVVLVIVPQIDLTPIQQTPAFTYFTAVWNADGDSQKEDDAFTALQTAVGNALADDIKTKFAPEANGQDPPKPYTRAQVRVSCSVLKLPASPPTKTTAWTQSPKAFAMPDRFVAILYNGGVEVKRIVGNPVADGLAVGPDPSLPPDEQIKKSGDDLVLNDDLLWMSDFERAVAVGMGIKVNLTGAEAANGFDRLVVLGLRFSSDEKTARTSSRRSSRTITQASMGSAWSRRAVPPITLSLMALLIPGRTMPMPRTQWCSKARTLTPNPMTRSSAATVNGWPRRWVSMMR